jgi:hypothetical protein
LVDWVGRGSAQGADLSVTVADLAGALRVEVEAGSAAAWRTPAEARLRVLTPSGAVFDTPLAATAPGRMGAQVPASDAGVYALTVITPDRLRTLRHLRAASPELGPVEPSAEIGAWQREGLVGQWSGAELQRTVEELTDHRQIPSRALALALVLFLLGLVVERHR